jgi:hypothetical protein
MDLQKYWKNEDNNEENIETLGKIYVFREKYERKRWYVVYPDMIEK